MGRSRAARRSCYFLTGEGLGDGFGVVLGLAGRSEDPKCPTTGTFCPIRMMKGAIRELCSWGRTMSS
jgi:hypothetical protein